MFHEYSLKIRNHICTKSKWNAWSELNHKNGSFRERKKCNQIDLFVFQSHFKQSHETNFDWTNRVCLSCFQIEWNDALFIVLAELFISDQRPIEMRNFLMDKLQMHKAPTQI